MLLIVIVHQDMSGNILMNYYQKLIVFNNQNGLSGQIVVLNVEVVPNQELDQ